jgi:hypothetical protein
MRYLLPAAFLLSVLFSSCLYKDERVRGNGIVKAESRDIDSFDKIHVSGNIDVYVTQGPVSPVRVEADENLLQYIEIEVRGDIINIKTKDRYDLNPTRDIKVYVSSPMVSGFEASGACHIFGGNKFTSPRQVDINLSGASGVTLDLNAPSIDADLSGACSIDLRGETKDLVIEGSGSSSAKCMDLKAENVDIDLSGAGDVETFASVSLDVDVSGAASVKYKGNPTQNKSISISGAGSVKKVE